MAGSEAHTYLNWTCCGMQIANLLTNFINIQITDYSLCLFLFSDRSFTKVLTNNLTPFLCLNKRFKKQKFGCQTSWKDITLILDTFIISQNRDEFDFNVTVLENLQHVTLPNVCLKQREQWFNLNSILKRALNSLNEFSVGFWGSLQN